MAVNRVYGSLDSGNTGSLNNFWLQAVASDPSTLFPGSFWLNTTIGSFKYSPDGSTVIDPRNRAFHLGTQAAATIVDLATTVKAYTLDSFAAPVAPVSYNNQRITNVATPTANTDAPNKGYVDAALDAALNGLSARDPVTVVATSNQALSGLPTIDGVTLTAGQRILLVAQTTTSQNGPYIVASGSWARPAQNPSDTQGELVLGAQWLVLSGSTYGSTKWRITAPTSGGITPGTTAVTITQVDQAASYTATNGVSLNGTTFSGVAAPSGGVLAGSTGFAVDTTLVARKFLYTITGDGSTSQFTVTHNLGNASASATVQDSNRNQITVPIQGNGANATYVSFPSAPANGVVFYVQVVG